MLQQDTRGVAAGSQRDADERFMQEALEQARAAERAGEVPIGAVVVYDGEVIARAHNLRECNEDPSAHAEFSAMVEASRVLGRWRLAGCTVYVTLEPCLMCAGLMVNARIDRCVYGAADPKGGALGSLYNLNSDQRLNHAFSVTKGVLENECAAQLSRFFSQVRAQRAQGERDLVIPDDYPRRRQAASTAAADPSVLEPAIVVASDSFKGSATSEEAERWIATGVRRVFPNANITCIPLGDGGEGTVDAACAALDGTYRVVQVSDPMGNTVKARYLLTAAGQAVLEMSSAAGIEFSDCTHDAALRASTYGAGQLVMDAIGAGAKAIYLGLGGSATTDGGQGFLRALGARVLDKEGRDVPWGLAGLERAAALDLEPALRALAGVELVALTDVSNPLVGRRGAVRVFGEQKGLADLPTPRGADPTTYASYDRWMIAFARLLDGAREHHAHLLPEPSSKAKRFGSVAGVPGAGAAGGMGAAVLACGGSLTSGVEAMLDLLDFDNLIRDADLIITGEGAVDGQTAEGKAPVGVARRAKRQHKPVALIAASRAYELDAVYKRGVDVVVTALRRPMPLDRAMQSRETRHNLVCAGETAARALLLGR